MIYKKIIFLSSLFTLSNALAMNNHILRFPRNDDRSVTLTATQFEAIEEGFEQIERLQRLFIKQQKTYNAQARETALAFEYLQKGNRDLKETIIRQRQLDQEHEALIAENNLLRAINADLSTEKQITKQHE